MENKILGNRYEIIRKIGSGGMADVYLAKCKLLNRHVAIKILKEEYTNDEEFVKRFKIEAQSVASLSHPNIVSIYDIGKDENIQYIVMEYIDGTTLKEYILKKQIIEWREAVEIAIKICSAIEHAHVNHIIHRDIKPHNILLTKDGIAKVTDFGIARAASCATITIIGNNIFGSAHYASPEQARGGYTDEKSDIYSIGVVLYEMLVGSVPFKGESPVTIALKHIQVEATDPILINNEIPAGLNQIVINAMQKDQTKRYQTVSNLLKDLNEVLKIPEGIYYLESKIDEFPTTRIEVLPKGQKSREIIIGMHNKDDKHKEIKNLKDNKNNKNDKITMWLAISTSVILMLIILIFSYKYISPFLGFGQSEAKTFIFGDYVGKNIKDVESELSKNGVEIKNITRKFDDTVPKDIIISQNKLKGEKIKFGGYSTLEFEVSDGQKLVKVPNVVKKDFRQAESEIIEKGLKTDIVEEFSDSIAMGMIIRTEPQSDIEIKPGMTVTLYKSKGAEEKYTKVPNLIGKDRLEASKLIADAKLVIGKTSPENSNIINKIIRQIPDPGKTVKEGTAVDLFFDTQIEKINKKTIKETINLSDPNKYGENIKVRVEAILSNIKKTEKIFEEVIKKSDFPISFDVNVFENGYTKVRVYLNDDLFNEFIEEWE